jgi:protein-S-isoprenylcysteine O-methyltransferase Ste14
VKRAPALLASFAFLVLAPGIVAGYVPWLMTRWRAGPPLLGLIGDRALGILLLVIGATVLLDSFARFAVQGRGTPAPVLPTTRLIATGAYRYVRNPMYVSVISLVIGQGLLFGSVRVLVYAGCLWVAFQLFIVLYEEPTLRRAYGKEYDRYRAAVPRWLPRVRPWTAP